MAIDIALSALLISIYEASSVMDKNDKVFTENKSQYCTPLLADVIS
jgi:hypothetical protein